MTAVCTYLEAILFAAGEPVPLSRLSLVLGVSELEVLDAAQELQNLLDEGGQDLPPFLPLRWKRLPLLRLTSR